MATKESMLASFIQDAPPGEVRLLRAQSARHPRAADTRASDSKLTYPFDSSTTS